MFARMMMIALTAVMVLALMGCSTTSPVGSTPEPLPAENPSAGSRLAPGLYDLEDGTVQAVGTLEYRDLEGGFWAVIGGTEADGNVGTVVAVIANGIDFEQQLKALDGRTVMVDGTRLEGVSIRMAGPEIEATSVRELIDTGGAAE